MVGLDGSGKTSILRQLIDQKPGTLQPTIPTMGMSSLGNPLIRSSD
jgi:GTPase SAR1 family protein